MKVILNQDIPNLGEEGDICEVAPGYARNFLMPRKMVLRYDRAALAALEERKADIQARKEEKRKAALGLKERLESGELTVTMPAGANGRLYGSVTSARIADELEKIGVSVERKRIDIPDNTIKVTGTTPIKISLYGGEVATLRVNVVAQSGGAAAAAPPSSAPAATQPAPAAEAEQAVEAEASDEMAEDAGEEDYQDDDYEDGDED